MHDVSLHKAATRYSMARYAQLRSEIQGMGSAELLTQVADSDSVVHRRDLRCSGQYSRYLRSLFRISLDCLVSALALYDKNDKPISAHIVLIRTAIECSSTALWLLSAGRDEKAVFYTLKFLYADSLNAAVTYGDLPHDETGPLAKILRELYVKLQQGLKDYKNHNIASHIQRHVVIKNADSEFVKKEKRERYDGLWAWRAASAVAHGNTGMVDSLSTILPINNPDKMGDRFGYMQPNQSLTVLLLLPAVENMRQAFSRFQKQLCLTQHPHRRAR